jgi:hypothetical protein
MVVTPLTYSSASSVPNYYQVYIKWYQRYTETGDTNLLSHAYHYARVAEEFNQAIISDDHTDETIYGSKDES